MAASAAHQTCIDLYAAYTAKLLGKAVTSASGGGRSVSYSDASLAELRLAYRQHYAQSAEAQADPDLPMMAPDGQTGERRPPVPFMTRSIV